MSQRLDRSELLKGMATRLFGEEPHGFVVEVGHCYDRPAHAVIILDCHRCIDERVLISYALSDAFASKNIADAFDRLKARDVA